MPRPVHFEVPADDPERAKEFYERAFGWKIEKWEGPIEYWLIMTGEESEQGIDGGLMKREGPETGIVNTIDVPDLDEYISKVEASGGRIVVPKMAVPSVGWMAYAVDTEGNTFGMMERDESAR